MVPLARAAWRSVRDHRFDPARRGRRRPLLVGPLRLEDRAVPATFTATNTNDAGAGSLRQAILDANADSVADQIVFDPGVNGQTITLSSGDMLISEPLNITGPGSGLLTIDANQTSRIIRV